MTLLLLAEGRYREVRVTLGRESVSVRADEDGAFAAVLPARGRGGPMLLSVEGSATRRFSDVLVGQVWLGAGQSNMEFALRSSAEAKAEAIDDSGNVVLESLKMPFTVEDNGAVYVAIDLRLPELPAAPAAGGSSGVGGSSSSGAAGSSNGSGGGGGTSATTGTQSGGSTSSETTSAAGSST